MPSLSLLALVPVILSILINPTRGDSKLDAARLGTEYTSMPLYRTGAGTNVLTVGIGTPEVIVNLTCSTNVEFFIVAAEGCGNCVQDSNLFSVRDSSSLTTTRQALEHTFIYPTGSSDTLSIGGQTAEELLTDQRGDGTTPRPIALAARVQANDPGGNLNGDDVQLPDGTSGFWGMGIFQGTKSDSMIASMIDTDSGESLSSAASFTVGFDIYNTTTREDDAGTIHWGGVPVDSYLGTFNWFNANTSVAGSWGFKLDSMRMGRDVVDLSGYYGSLDPAFDQIYMPTAVAETFFSKVPNAERDRLDTTRWNIPCDSQIHLTFTIDDREYVVDPARLVQARDTSGRTCWSSVVAWQNGSIPEQQGEVRLGTPFMSGLYMALYYSDSEQYIGLAGKPNSVNGADIATRSDGHRNAKLAAILIGVLLGVLVLLLLFCYSRNRNSFQSVWYRAMRRQQRAQMNMVVRGATLPPPMMMPVPGTLPIVPPMMGPPVPPMMPMPIGGGMPPPGPTMMGRMLGPGGLPQGQGQAHGYQSVPPPYQPPISGGPTTTQAIQQQQHIPLLQNQRQQKNPAPIPQTVQQRPRGYYSPRPQTTSPSRSGLLPIRFRHESSDHSQSPHQSRREQKHRSPPASGESRVKWGNLGAHNSRSVRRSGLAVNEHGTWAENTGSLRSDGRQYVLNLGQPDQRGYGREADPAANGKQRRSAPATSIGQNQHVQNYSDGGVNAPSEGQGGGRGGNEKKRYFAWRPKSTSSGERGERRPVESPRKKEKRRSWFGYSDNRQGGWKDEERQRETERMVAGQGWAR
ncbi:hypothetical protein IAR55_001264 [Kwoniella newhampshirensis]|uniref:Peptidase A1 domain-containing protein n=1 Tax=Kwoniella newhampshirensis TaxID=1651941 RepID=A0AAW0Z563_9TREE